MAMLATRKSKPMNPHDQSLNELLQSLSTEPDLHPIVNRFLNLSEDSAFLDACKPANNKDLVQIVAIGLKKKLGLDTSGLQLRFQHYSRFDFFHGGGMLYGRIVQCFYFRREKRGCITVATLAGKCDYLRISAVKLPASKNPERN